MLSRWKPEFVTVFIFLCGLIAGCVLLKSPIGNALGMQRGDRLSNAPLSIASNSDVFIRVPTLEFSIDASESKVWFALEVVNPRDQDVKVVGFETSCSCNSIDQSLPMILPKGESRFLTGSIDVNGIKGDRSIQSQVFLDTGSSEGTKFHVLIHPKR